MKYFFGLLLCLEVAWAQERIVVAGGALTEIVYALGAGDQVVGVDTTSRHLPEAQRLPQIGYLRALAVEGILALKPEWFLASEAAGPPEVLARLRQAGVKVELVPESNSPVSVLEKIDRLAKLLRREEQGERLKGQVAAEFADLARQVAKVPQRPKVAFLLTLAQGIPLAAGFDTQAAMMIGLAGGENAFSYPGYRAVSAESLLLARPDWLVVSRLLLEQLGSLENLWRLPGMSAIPVGQKRQVVVVETTDFLGFGLRAPKSAQALFARLHSE